MSLGRIGPDAAAAWRELISLLGEKNERIGEETVVALGRIGALATDPLVTACADANVTVRTRAALSLGMCRLRMKRPNRRCWSAC